MKDVVLRRIQLSTEDATNARVEFLKDISGNIKVIEEFIQPSSDQTTDLGPRPNARPSSQSRPNTAGQSGRGVAHEPPADAIPDSNLRPFVNRRARPNPGPSAEDKGPP